MGGSAQELVALAFGLEGLALGFAFFFSRRLRESGAVHVLALANLVVGSIAVLRAEQHARDGLHSTFAASTVALLFLGAAVCHLPVLVWIVLHWWSRLLEALTSPGRRDRPRVPARTARQSWLEARRHLDALSRNPVSAYHRRRLAEVYLRLGLIDSAIGELRKAIECLESGYEQAHLIFKTAHLIVDERGDVPAAVPLLRRLVRLYPRSYFAAYARRVINRHEAHREANRGPGPSGKGRG